MPKRTLEGKEWKLRQLSGGNQVWIHACKDPKDHDDVAVDIKVKYDDKSEAEFSDKVNINAKGEADHATAVGKKVVDTVKTKVVIEWK